MHKSAYEDAQKFVSKYLKDRYLTIADIGSYDVNGTLRPIFDNPKWKYVGYDIEIGPNVDFLLSSHYDWSEIKSNSFDVVVSTQVLEHVKHPWRWIKEVYRICKPNGIIYVCTPNSIGYHAFPIDCWRVWPEGMNALFEEAGVIPLDVYAINGDTTGIGSKLVEIKFN